MATDMHIDSGPEIGRRQVHAVPLPEVRRPSGSSISGKPVARKTSFYKHALRKRIFAGLYSEPLNASQRYCQLLRSLRFQISRSLAFRGKRCLQDLLFRGEHDQLEGIPAAKTSILQIMPGSTKFGKAESEEAAVAMCGFTCLLAFSRHFAGFFEGRM